MIFAKLELAIGENGTQGSCDIKWLEKKHKAITIVQT
jgi:hypothetical protein